MRKVASCYWQELKELQNVRTSNQSERIQLTIDTGQGNYQILISQVM